MTGILSKGRNSCSRINAGKFLVLMLRISLNIVCPFDESTGREFEESDFWKSRKHSTNTVQRIEMIFIPFRKWDYLMATHVNENNGKTISVERSPKWLQLNQLGRKTTKGTQEMLKKDLVIMLWEKNILI